MNNPVQSLQVLEPLRQQMEQLFDDILRTAAPTTSNSNTTWAPVKIQETEAEIILKAEVPVIDAKNMDVEVSQSAVSIVGEAMKSTQRFFRPEFHHGRCFQRIVPLTCKNDQVKAEFKDGILTLTMPVRLAQRRLLSCYECNPDLPIKHGQDTFKKSTILL